MRKWLIIIQVVIGFHAYCQDIKSEEEDHEEEYQNFWKYGKEIGLNMTQLAGRFVPFNFTNKSGAEQIIALKTKWYGNKRAFIINAGLDINDNSEENQLFLSLGYERRRHISAKWKYTTGWEAFAGVLTVSQSRNGPIIGVTKPYGIEYHFYDNFYISTEARLILGGGDGGTTFKINYPTSVFLNILIN